VKSKAAFEVEIDIPRNVVFTRAYGTITAVEMQEGAAQAERVLGQLRPGFSVLADMTALDLMELECVPHLTRMMDLFKASGVALVVRVMPDLHKDIGLNILSLIHYRGEVRIITCATLAEAEQELK
jgi:hypothetical protein